VRHERVTAFGRHETQNGISSRARITLEVDAGIDLAQQAARQAPHVNVCFLSRGLLRQIYTRIYFEGDARAAGDAILGLVPAERRHTLMAHQIAAEPGTWEFVMRLQGDDETVFFDL